MLPAREAGFSTDRRGPPTPVARHRTSDDVTGARQALEIAVAGCGSCRSPSRHKALTLQRVFDLIARSGAGRRGHGPTGDPGAMARSAKRETLLMQVRDDPAGGSRATG